MRAVGVSRRHRTRLAVGVLDLDDRRVERDRAAAVLDQLGALLPHLARPVLGVVELLDEAGDLLALVAAADHLGPDRLPHRGEEGHALDALCAPVGRDLRRGDAPDLLVVGLEEVVVEAPAVVGDDVALERVLVLRRTDLRPHVREAAEHRLDRTEVLQRVQRLDRVVVELAAVVDVAHPRAAQEVVGPEDLEPQVVDRLHLGEEPVATDVEAPAVAHRGTADPADDLLGLEHLRSDAPLRQHVGRGEAGRSGSDDDDVVIGAGGLGTGGLGARHWFAHWRILQVGAWMRRRARRLGTQLRDPEVYGAAAFPPGSWDRARARIRGLGCPGTPASSSPRAPPPRGRRPPVPPRPGRSPPPARARTGTCSSSSARRSRGSAPRGRAAA